MITSTTTKKMNGVNYEYKYKYKSIEKQVTPSIDEKKPENVLHGLCGPPEAHERENGKG